MVAFMLRWQSSVFARENLGPERPKIFSVWAFTEKVGQLWHLVQPMYYSFQLKYVGGCVSHIFIQVIKNSKPNGL